MTEPFLNGKVTLHAGDCLDVLADLAECSIDSVVTDPPYHLTSIVKRFGGEDRKAWEAIGNNHGGGASPYQRTSVGFMGKRWDGGDVAFRPETWTAVYRVLKPGGYLLAFGGTRTYHRMACAIEDAGFEIRDTLSFLYGSGFPKSHDVGKRLDASEKRCTCDPNVHDLRCNLDTEDTLSSGTQQDVLADMQRDTALAYQGGSDQKTTDRLRPMWSGGERPTTDETAEASGGLLQPVVSSKSSLGANAGQARSQGPSGLDGNESSILPHEDDGAAQSGMEGRGDIPDTPRELRERSLCAMSAGIDVDGEGGRLRDGAPPSDGEADRSAAHSSGMRPSPRPSTVEQCADESGIMAVQPQSQERGAWPHCERCGKPIIPDGLGTALKPACELIVLARKPLSEGTVAANVLAHGTGAINIDGCRVATETPRPHIERRNDKALDASRNTYGSGINGSRYLGETTTGRWPANVIHDGSDEVVAAFPETTPSTAGVRNNNNQGHEGWSGTFRSGPLYSGHEDSGSAARFFYSAKADSNDRIGSKHPTVKPVDLMQYLVRLVTKPGGTVLDPFAGTGTTGEAAWREGMRAVLIEREPDYQADIRRRMALCMAGPDERVRESIKARGAPIDYGPLFAALQEAAE